MSLDQEAVGICRHLIQFGEENNKMSMQLVELNGSLVDRENSLSELQVKWNHRKVTLIGLVVSFLHENSLLGWLNEFFKQEFSAYRECSDLFANIKILENQKNELCRQIAEVAKGILHPQVKIAYLEERLKQIAGKILKYSLFDSTKKFLAVRLENNQDLLIFTLKGNQHIPGQKLSLIHDHIINIKAFQFLEGLLDRNQFLPALAPLNHDDIADLKEMPGQLNFNDEELAGG